MAEGDFPKVDGDAWYASEINGGLINVVYTGSGFDASTATANSQELTTVTSSEIGSADYLKIKILYTTTVAANTTQSASYSLKIRTKDVGGSFSDSLATTTVKVIPTETAGTRTTTDTQTLEWVHTLTANEKSAGCVVEITGTKSGAATGSITNIQTTVQSLNSSI